MWRSSRPLVVALALVAGLTACGHDAEKAKRQHLEKGNAFFQQRKFSDATVEYRAAIAEDGRFADAHYRLGLAYEQLGDRGPPLLSLPEIALHLRKTERMPERHFTRDGF
jgi:Tfp pilus assembly protein PilF